MFGMESKPIDYKSIIEQPEGLAGKVCAD